MRFLDPLISSYLARHLLRAPNQGQRIDQLPLPRPPLFDAAFRVEVGPPAASLACWVMEPKAWRVRVLPEDQPVPETSLYADRYQAPRLPSGERPWVVIDAAGTDPPTPRPTVLLIHGYNDSVNSRPYLRALGAMLASQGHRVVMPDLRGHGYSSGDWLSYGLIDRWDMTRLLDHLQARDLAGKTVGVVGHSYGGNVALMHAAVDDRVGAVVAASAPHSLRGVLPVSVKTLRPSLAWLVRDRTLDLALVRVRKRTGLDYFESSAETAVRHTRALVLLLHGEQDRTVPADCSRQILQARTDGVDAVFWDDETHASYFTSRLEELGDRVGAFFARHV